MLGTTGRCPGARSVLHCHAVWVLLWCGEGSVLKAWELHFGASFLPNRDVCSFEWFDVWILMLRWLGCWAGERARYSNSHSDWLLRPMKRASFSFLVSFLDSKTVGLRSLVCSKLLKGRRHGAEPFNLKKMETFKTKHIRIWIKMIKTNEKSKTGEVEKLIQKNDVSWYKPVWLHRHMDG